MNILWDKFADLRQWWTKVDILKKFDPKKLKITDKDLFVGRGYLIFYKYVDNPDVKKVEVGDTLDIDGKFYKMTGRAFGRVIEGGELIFVKDA
jgi:predicted dithiol-disulfide oxidoreductase (DUF899 family)